MDREMWRVIVVNSDSDRQPRQEMFYFWNEEEAEFFYNKTTEECFNSPDCYCYALKPVKVK